MKKEIYLSILGLVAGELMMFYGHSYIGTAIHIINIEAMTFTLMFRNTPLRNKNVLESLMLLLLLRIINLAMPQFFTLTLLSYPLIYGVMLFPVYSIIRMQAISVEELGVNSKLLSYYLPAGFIIGTATALIEFTIIDPKAMIENLRFNNLLLIITVMFVFVGLVEELIFRSILLTRLEIIFGESRGLLISGALFGIMHAGYGIASEILFGIVLGLLIGYIFQKTRSFPFILTIHGTANVMLFGVIPLILK